MTPAEHRAEAERLLAESETSRYVATQDRLVRKATLHALLALALPAPRRGGY